MCRTEVPHETGVSTACPGGLNWSHDTATKRHGAAVCSSLPPKVVLSPRDLPVGDAWPRAMSSAAEGPCAPGMAITPSRRGLRPWLGMCVPGP
jgi:hypothetical protein